MECMPKNIQCTLRPAVFKKKNNSNNLKRIVKGMLWAWRVRITWGGEKILQEINSCLQFNHSRICHMGCIDLLIIQFPPGAVLNHWMWKPHHWLMNRMGSPKDTAALAARVNMQRGDIYSTLGSSGKVSFSLLPVWWGVCAIQNPKMYQRREML